MTKVPACVRFSKSRILLAPASAICKDKAGKTVSVQHVASNIRTEAKNPIVLPAIKEKSCVSSALSSALEVSYMVLNPSFTAIPTPSLVPLSPLSLNPHNVKAGHDGDPVVGMNGPSTR